MIPIRDMIPSRRFPIVTILIIVSNVLIFLFQSSLGKSANDFVLIFGMIPQRYFYLTNIEPLNLIERFYPFFTSIFLHGSLMHLIGNMWFLWIFGDNVEDRFGRKWYLFFYILAGLIAGFAHAYLNSGSAVPTVGASGAIAGVMGAYLIFYPRAKVLTIIPLFIFFPLVEIYAVFFLGLWFLFQFISVTVEMISTGNDCCGVAWWAHIGGFITGILIAGTMSLRVRKT